jgi:hypothetical protein
MECPKCQTDNPDGARFCNGYGIRLEIACTECRQVNLLICRFCNECGHPLTESVPTPVPETPPCPEPTRFAGDRYLEEIEVCTAMRMRPELTLTRLHLAELPLEHYPEEKSKALEHLDLAISEFREMKMQPALERALRHKEMLKRSNSPT